MSKILIDGSLSVGIDGSDLTLVIGDVKLSVPFRTKHVRLGGPFASELPHPSNLGGIIPIVMTKGDSYFEVIDKITGATLFKAKNLKMSDVGHESTHGLSDALRGTPFFNEDDENTRIKVEPGTEPPPYSFIDPDKQRDCIDLTGSDDGRESSMNALERRFVIRLLDAIVKEKDFADYTDPVNPKELARTGGGFYFRYPKVVKKPMDLSTISSKLTGGQYVTVHDITEDVFRMAENAKIWYRFEKDELLSEEYKPVMVTGQNLLYLWSNTVRAYLQDPSREDKLIKSVAQRSILPSQKAKGKNAGTKASKNTKSAATFRRKAIPTPPSTKKTGGAYPSTSKVAASTHVPATTKSSRKRKASYKPAARRVKKVKVYDERFGDEDYLASEAEETDHTDDDYDSYDDGSGFVNNGRIDLNDTDDDELFFA